MTAIPISAQAAAAALAASTLTLEHVKIGDLLVSACTGLSGPNELVITDKPIGLGYNIADAAVDVQIEKTLDIVFVNPQYSAEQISAALLNGDIDSLTESWGDKKDKLYEKQSTREIVTLQTHEGSYENMLLRIIDPIYDNVNNWDAWRGTVTLTQINPATSEGGGGLIDSALENLGEL
jgi:hypothetical protein